MKTASHLDTGHQAVLCVAISRHRGGEGARGFSGPRRGSGGLEGVEVGRAGGCAGGGG